MYWVELLQYSGQKKKLNGREVAKYFSPVRGGVYSFLHHCIMVGVPHYILWLEGDMSSRSFFISIFPPQPLIFKVANC